MRILLLFLCRLIRAYALTLIVKFSLLKISCQFCICCFKRIRDVTSAYTNVLFLSYDLQAHCISGRLRIFLAFYQSCTIVSDSFSCFTFILRPCIKNTTTSSNYLSPSGLASRLFRTKAAACSFLSCQALVVTDFSALFPYVVSGHCLHVAPSLHVKCTFLIE